MEKKNDMLKTIIIAVCAAIAVVAAIIVIRKAMKKKKAALAEAKTIKGKPTAIIAKSIKGKGVSYMENKCEWHGQAPKEPEYMIAIEELKKIEESLK